MPLHAHDVAFDICENGTSMRRYQHVKLVEVPEEMVQEWLATNMQKAKLNPQLADFAAMSHTEPYYASLNGTHFAEAHKLIMEGKRRFWDEPEARRFMLNPADEEGRIIQESGVTALVYSAELWGDPAALLALLREDDIKEPWPKWESVKWEW